MKIIISLIFLFANIIFVNGECNIEINTKNPNTNKDINIKCEKNDVYCENTGELFEKCQIYDSNTRDYGVKNRCYDVKTGKETHPNIINRLTGEVDCKESEKHITKCNLKLYLYEYEGLKKTLDKNNFKCNNTYTESKSKYDKCLDDVKSNNNLANTLVNAGYRNVEDYCCRKYLVGTVYKSQADCFW